MAKVIFPNHLELLSTLVDFLLDPLVSLIRTNSSPGLSVPHRLAKRPELLLVVIALSSS